MQYVKKGNKKPRFAASGKQIKTKTGQEQILVR